MLKLFIYSRLPGTADSKLLRLFQSENEHEGKLFQKIPAEPFRHMVQFVPNVDEAHYILMPHDYLFLKNGTEYLREIDNFAIKNNKKIIVHLYGDSPEKVALQQAIILRPCSYRSTLSPNEIIIPAFIEDLGMQYEVTPKHKHAEKPVIGFAGMVALPTKISEIKYQIRMLLTTVQVLLGFKTRAETQGLYFRRRFVKKLIQSDKCKTNFIIRNSFSAHDKTISMDPVVLRQEYIDVLKDSDLSLVIRGDGNYSLRFFEVLSLGRIPLFIDTDTPLPFEDEIDYDSFMLRVNYKDLRRLPTLIEEFWKNTSDQQFQEMQKKARKVFETKLRTNVFYKELFTKLEERVR